MLGAVQSARTTKGERFVAVSEIPPVESPVTTLKSSMLANERGKK